MLTYIPDHLPVKPRITIHLLGWIVPLQRPPCNSTPPGLASYEHHFSGQCFRIGAATTAAHAGIEDLVVRMLGCWESAAYQ